MRYIILLGLLVTRTAHAGYDKTDWGMSIKRVQKLYPGGVVKKQQTGEIDYYIIRSIVSSPAWVGFRFDSSGALVFVGVVFTKAGTSIDLKLEAFTVPSGEESARIYDILSVLLQRKYGDPGKAKPNSLLWHTSDGDSVLLEMKAGAGVQINYAKANSVDTRGL